MSCEYLTTLCELRWQTRSSEGYDDEDEDFEQKQTGSSELEFELTVAQTPAGLDLNRPRKGEMEISIFRVIALESEMSLNGFIERAATSCFL